MESEINVDFRERKKRSMVEEREEEADLGRGQEVEEEEDHPLIAKVN